MREFASSAMIRLLQAGLLLHKLPLPDLPKTDHAHVEKQKKSHILQGLLDHYGPKTVLSLTDSVHNISGEPLLAVLGQAVDPEDLMTRWQRMERFAHSHHYVTYESLGDTKVILHHQSRKEGHMPSMGEDLVVFGLLTHLCEIILKQAVEAGPKGTAKPWRSGGYWREVHGQERQGPWEISWTHDKNITAYNTNEPPTPGTNFVQIVRKIIAEDLNRSWRLDSLASLMGMSGRSLQRHLKANTLSLTQVIVEEQVSAASRMLLSGDQDLAAIGFLCGFSDQSHFTRKFKRIVGCTPGHYRREFT